MMFFFRFTKTRFQNTRRGHYILTVSEENEGKKATSLSIKVYHTQHVLCEKGNRKTQAYPDVRT